MHGIDSYLIAPFSFELIGKPDCKAVGLMEAYTGRFLGKRRQRA